MSGLEYLASRGISVWVKPSGKLGLKGLSNLDDLERKEVIQWAGDNKGHLVEILTHTNKAKKANKATPAGTSQNTQYAKKAKKDVEELLWRVNAYTRRESDGETLVFSPPLAAPEVDPERWELAGELAELFSRGLLPAPKDTDPQEKKPPSKNRSLITKNMLRAWKSSRPWLLARLPELELYGWTRTKLFRAGQLKYPVGPWGIAFSGNWLREDATFTITAEGHMECTWQEPTGRVVAQTWRPSV